MAVDSRLGLSSPAVAIVPIHPKFPMALLDGSEERLFYATIHGATKQSDY